MVERMTVETTAVLPEGDEEIGLLVVDELPAGDVAIGKFEVALGEDRGRELGDCCGLLLEGVLLSGVEVTGGDEAAGDDDEEIG